MSNEKRPVGSVSDASMSPFESLTTGVAVQDLDEAVAHRFLLAGAAVGRRLRARPPGKEPLEKHNQPDVAFDAHRRAAAPPPHSSCRSMFSNSDLSAADSLPADAGADREVPNNDDEPAVRPLPVFESNRSVPVAFSRAAVRAPALDERVEELRRRIGHQPASSVFTVTQPEMCLGKQSANKHTELRPRPLVQTAREADIADSAPGSMASPGSVHQPAVARALEHHFRSA